MLKHMGIRTKPTFFTNNKQRKKKKKRGKVENIND